MYVGPSYCRAEMYAGRFVCCPWRVTVSMPTGQMDRRTDARPLHYAFRYRHGQHKDIVPGQISDYISCLGRDGSVASSHVTGVLQVAWL